MPATVDFVKQEQALYQPKDVPVLVTVPTFTFLTIDGEGDPNTSPQYAAAVSALYAAAYALKFAVREALGIDYRVLPLEGLWWSRHPVDFTGGDKRDWQWTLMIRQPVSVTEEQITAGRDKAGAKVGQLADRLRLIELEEGASAQILHRGPYATEAPTIARLHQFIAERGLRPRDKHHEIYLSDPSRTKPERMRTVIRQPVEPA